MAQREFANQKLAPARCRNTALKPAVRGATRAIARVLALRHDTFQPELAPPQQSKLGGADPLLRRSKPLVSRGLLPDSLRRREAKKVCGRARFGGRPRFR